jgi:isopenicillin N synthase-like dioxygenase
MDRGYITVPKIDFSRISDCEIQAFRDAFQNFSIIEIINHDIEDSLWNNLLKISKEFFELEDCEKEEILMPANSNSFRGYTPVFQETTPGQTPNWYELIEFGVDFPRTDPRVIENKPMFGRNLYPKNNKIFKDVFRTYTSKLKNIGMQILDMFSLSIGLQKSFFSSQIFHESHWQFRMLHYPDRKDIATKHYIHDKPDYSCGAHTDYGLITLIQYDKPGLEIQLHDGTWKKLKFSKNALICILGESIEYWTNSFYKALTHRVYTNKERYSFPFFLQPNYDTMIKPFILKENKIIYTGNDFQYGPYSYEKYKKIYNKI